MQWEKRYKKNEIILKNLKDKKFYMKMTVGEKNITIFEWGEDHG